MITIVPWRAAWQAEFHRIAGQLRQTLGEQALRIDHIGSTSVPGLAAKDVIDIQITVRALDPVVEGSLKAAGYSRVRAISADHVPPGADGNAQDWDKWVFGPAPSERPANIHVRVAGKPNQRYALLFRDYLRAHSTEAQAYERVKIALARLHPQDKDAYYAVKDPVCDLVICAAEAWAASTRWQEGESDA